MTDKNTLNSALLSVLDAVESPVQELEKKDFNLEGVHIRLESMASSPTCSSSKLAADILEMVAKGRTLGNSIRETMEANPDLKNNMIEEFKLASGALPHIRKKFEEILHEAPQVESSGFELDHVKGFDKACGLMIKEVLDMLPNQNWLRHINIMKIQKIHDSAAESAGKMIREPLEQWNMQKIIDKALKGVAASQMEGGKWKNKDGKMMFVKPDIAPKEGCTRDFHLPLTPEAEREYKIKQLSKSNELDYKVQHKTTWLISYITKGIFKSMVSSTWQKLLETVYKSIDVTLQKFPRLQSALKAAIVFCLETIFAQSVQRFYQTMEYIFEKPFTLILDKVFSSYQAEKLIRWTQMAHVHDEFMWDAFEVIVDETLENAAKVGA